MSTETAAAFYVTCTYNLQSRHTFDPARDDRKRNELSNRGCKCENRNRFAGHRMDSDGGTSETFLWNTRAAVIPHGDDGNDGSVDKGSCKGMRVVLVSITVWWLTPLKEKGCLCVSRFFFNNLFVLMRSLEMSFYVQNPVD